MNIRMGLDATRKKGTGTNFAQEAYYKGKIMVSEIRASPLFSLICIKSFSSFAKEGVIRYKC
jgi:hypothetical protein